MPIYEYQCAKCKKVHEIWQKITAKPETKCPSCGGRIDRLLSAAGFALKGTGWYKTDYERKPSKAAKKDGEGGESKKPETSGDGGSGSSGSDSKARAA